MNAFPQGLMPKIVLMRLLARLNRLRKKTRLKAFGGLGLCGG